MKVDFKTQFSENLLKPLTNPGSPIKTSYFGEYDKKGNVIVKEKGKENIYAKIQSYADECDINILIKKFESGDTDAFNKRTAEFMDVSSLPDTYAGILNLVNRSSDYFNSLPVELKEKFDNDVNKFIATIGTEEHKEKLTLKKVEKDEHTATESTAS